MIIIISKVNSIITIMEQISHNYYYYIIYINIHVAYMYFH